MFSVILNVLTISCIQIGNAYCIKRLISIRIVTPLTSEVIIVTMHTLLYTIKPACMPTLHSVLSLVFNPVWFDSVYILAQFK